MSANNRPRYWAIVPAAGQGVRMGQAIPKQYLPLQDKTIIEHTLNRLLTYSRIEKIIIVLNQNDAHWPTLAIANDPRIITTLGGMERCHSVLNGLKILEKYVAADDWILVHDAVRPCLKQEDIDRLINTLAEHPIGGLLGVPIRYTVKRVNEGKITATIDRSELWQAFTPQMFRYHLLYQALAAAIAQQRIVTDEAMAVELTGAKPLMIQGREDNIKITNPLDLVLASFYLEADKG